MLKPIYIYNGNKPFDISQSVEIIIKIYKYFY